MFQSLLIKDWRQFRGVEIAFHERLTLLTGANGAGKTTILHLLNRHWGWKLPYVSTPRIGKSGRRRYWAGFWGRSKASKPPAGPPTDSQVTEIGRIVYNDGRNATLTVPRNVSETFSVTIADMPVLAGVYVPSHRPLYLHQKVDEIPTQVDVQRQLFNVYLSEMQNRFKIQARVQSPSHKLKQSLMSLATFGSASESVVPNHEARRTFEGFQSALRELLPRSLGFRRFRIHVPDVILDTDSGNFAFDAVSGGISAIIDIGWQVYLYSLLHDKFIVVIDEPEAHLHPELQQEILPNLLKAFPQAQFIVATHNPFIVSSVLDSHVYVLRYNRSRVESVLLDQVNKAGTADEILREVLGVRTTTPIWVNRRLEEIISRYAQRSLDQETLSSLRDELKSLGLERYVPQAITNVLDIAENSAE